MQPTENMTLDDFPTLRHVLIFLAGGDLKKNLTPSQAEATGAAEAVASTSPAAANGTAGHAHESAGTNGAAAAHSAASNPAYAKGFDAGRQNRAEIRRVLRRFADSAGVDFESPAPMAATIDPAGYFAAEELAELEGMADAVNMPLASLVVHKWIAPRSRANGQANGHSKTAPRPEQAAAVESPVAKAPPAGSPRYDLDDRAEESTQRFVMTMFELPLEASVPAMPKWHGAALVVGNNPTADALRKLLASVGVPVRSLEISADVDATVAAFEQIWTEQPTPHVFLCSARDADMASPYDEARWQRRWNRVVLAPFFLCQRWIQLAGAANMLKQCSLVGTTALGGDFALSNSIPAPESAALAGLMKAIYVEIGAMRSQKPFRATAVDAPLDANPDRLAADICRELASGANDYEVGYVDGRRSVGYALPEKAPVEPYCEVRPGGVWVFTGGARGITAVSALELGKRFKLKMHLIGTSPIRPIDPAWRNLSADELKTLKGKVMRDARAAGQSMDEAWARAQKDIEIDHSLRAFADAGVDFTYHACDVADRDALGRVLDTIRRTSGPIEGIVHGAGIERAAAFERKVRDSVLATIASKVDGALNLIRLTTNDPIRHWIGYGSVSGRMGSNGQTDYCLASDMLCKLANWYRQDRPGVRAVGFHWHPWGEVGMAARPESVTMLKMTDGPEQMPTAEGLRHLVRELYAGVPAGEVMVTSWDYHGRFFGTEDHPKETPDGGAGPASPAAAPERSSDRPATATTSKSGTPTAARKLASPAADATWPKLPFERLTERLELKMEAAPLSPGAPQAVEWLGAACILGHNASALALRDRLVAEGVVVHMLPDAHTVEEATVAIEALYSSHPFRHLFLMSGRDEQPLALWEAAGWNQYRNRGLLIPFFATQHWFRLRMKARDKTPITVVAATSMGGDFGLSCDVARPEGGAICGLLKSLYIEDSRQSPSEVRVKVVDAPADEPAPAVAEAIVSELAAGEPTIEVAWSHGRRSVVRAFAKPVESLVKRVVPQGGTWVLTGGARGITAAVAFELGKRFGCKLHLVGRSPAPQADSPWRNASEEKLKEIKAQIVRQAIAAGRSPESEWEKVKGDIEIHETLARFAAAGLQTTYHSCDLADWDQFARVLDDVRRQDGPIEGVVHGAGWTNSGKFAARSRAHVERGLAGKLDGAVGLMSLTRQDPLRYFITFGSISGRYGANGLSDYATANEMLAKLTDWYAAQRPNARACCFHWQSWDEVGMAMLGDSAVGTKGILKMAFIPPKEGVEHLARDRGGSASG